MHHLFQGIVKSIFELTADWLTHKVGNHFKKFCLYINGSLTKLHILGLDWCRMEPLVKGRTYTSGGWQAEQFLAFARCSLIVFSAIRDIVGNREVGINEHEFMSQTLLCFLSRLMHDDATKSDEQMHYIKCFLSACDLFEHVAYQMNGSNPIWHAKGNFLSLLNLPDQISHFGSLTNYWEGSRERSIQQIKPYLINMRSSSSFCKAKLKKMYTTQTLKNMYEDHSPPTMAQSIKNDRYSSFKVYPESRSLTSLIEENDVLSVIVTKSEQNEEDYFICKRIKESSLCQLFKVAFDDKSGFNKCGLWYAPLHIDSVPLSNTYDRGFINEMACDFAILCPCISSVPDLKSCYTLFSKNWQYRTSSFSSDYPTFSYNFILSIFNENSTNR